VLEGSEECDDGNKDNDDGCVDMCKTAECGDKFVQAGVEDCDDGNENSGDGCTMCAKDCGNGTIDKGNNEECDDGNTMGGDTCDPACKRLAFMTFISSMKWKGDLGGLDGADSKCNTLAAGKQPGIYKAWLSDGTDDPAARLHKSTKPYIRPDNAKVADDWAKLISVDLLNTINRTESNQAVTGAMCNSEALVWTNTLKDGTAEGTDHCADWKDATMGLNGAGGLATAKGVQWTDLCLPKCDTPARIYCIEQPAP
jgi:cysteine-rich repeat protein